MSSDDDDDDDGDNHDDDDDDTRCSLSVVLLSSLKLSSYSEYYYNDLLAPIYSIINENNVWFVLCVLPDLSWRVVWFLSRLI